jgi:hypothetical protein
MNPSACRIFSQIAVAFLGLGASASVAVAQSPSQKPRSYTPLTLTAKATYQPPELDGRADDPVWQDMKPLSLRAIGGSGFKNGRGQTSVQIRAVYTSEMLYFLVEYDDPTASLQFEPYVKVEDGRWQPLSSVEKSPSGKANAAPVFFHEDKLAFLWNVDESIQHFSTRYGCQAACHGGNTPRPGQTVKRTTDESELGDVWIMKTVRTAMVGQVDDHYLDNTEPTEKTPRAGLKPDLKTGGGYETIPLQNGAPAFMSREAQPVAQTGRYWMHHHEQVPFTAKTFAIGDQVPSIRLSPFAGDRGDILGSATWEKGRWTVEVARKLVTDSHYDINFRDLSASYGFGLALFDNTPGGHAMVREPLRLIFKP